MKFNEATQRERWGMGFSLESFFNELIAIIESDMKPKKKWPLLVRHVYDGYKYAKECRAL